MQEQQQTEHESPAADVPLATYDVEQEEAYPGYSDGQFLDPHQGLHPQQEIYEDPAMPVSAYRRSSQNSRGSSRYVHPQNRDGTHVVAELGRIVQTPPVQGQEHQGVQGASTYHSTPQIPYPSADPVSPWAQYPPAPVATPAQPRFSIQQAMDALRKMSPKSRAREIEHMRRRQAKLKSRQSADCASSNTETVQSDSQQMPTLMSAFEPTYDGIYHGPVKASQDDRQMAAGQPAPFRFAHEAPVQQVGQKGERLRTQTSAQATAAPAPPLESIPQGTSRVPARANPRNPHVSLPEPVQTMSPQEIEVQMKRLVRQREMLLSTPNNRARVQYPMAPPPRPQHEALKAHPTDKYKKVRKEEARHQDLEEPWERELKKVTGQEIAKIRKAGAPESQKEKHRPHQISHAMPEDSRDSAHGRGLPASPSPVGGSHSHMPTYTSRTHHVSAREAPLLTSYPVSSRPPAGYRNIFGPHAPTAQPSGKATNNSVSRVSVGALAQTPANMNGGSRAPLSQPSMPQSGQKRQRDDNEMTLISSPKKRSRMASVQPSAKPSNGHGRPARPPAPMYGIFGNNAYGASPKAPVGFFSHGASYVNDGSGLGQLGIQPVQGSNVGHPRQKRQRDEDGIQPVWAPSQSKRSRTLDRQPSEELRMPFAPMFPIATSQAVPDDFCQAGSAQGVEVVDFAYSAQKLDTERPNPPAPADDQPPVNEAGSPFFAGNVESTDSQSSSPPTETIEQAPQVDNIVQGAPQESASSQAARARLDALLRPSTPSLFESSSSPMFNFQDPQLSDFTEGYNDFDLDFTNVEETPAEGTSASERTGTFQFPGIFSRAAELFPQVNESLAEPITCPTASSEEIDWNATIDDEFWAKFMNDADTAADDGSSQQGTAQDPAV